MAFNPVESFNQGNLAGQNLLKSQQQNQIRDLQNALAGQAGQSGFNADNNLNMQRLAALDPSSAEKSRSTFMNLSESRKKAYFQDVKTAQDKLLAGDLEGVERLFADRRSDVIKLNGDTTQVDYMTNLLNTGQFDELREGFAATITRGQEFGYLSAPESQKREAFQQGKGGLVFDPNTGAYTIDPLAMQRYDQMAEKAITTGELDFKDRQSLNKDVTAIVKESIGIRSAAAELDQLKGRGTAAAKLGAVFKFMKALDPTSVVRESEQGQVYSAQGAGSEVAGMINGLLGKGKLTEEGFQDLVDTAKIIANSNIGSTSDQVGKLLDTFGDTIPVTFKQKVAERVPVLFKVSAPITQTKSLDSMTVEELKALKAGM